MGTIAMATANTKDLSLLPALSVYSTLCSLEVSNTEWRTPNLDLVTGHSYRCYSGTASGYAHAFLYMPSDLTTVYTRFAFKIPTNISSEITILEFWEGAFASLHGIVKVIPNGGVIKTYRSTTQLTATAANAFSPFTWNVIEVMFTPADSGGRFVIKINGATVADYTGDTRNTGTAGRVSALKLGLITAGIAEMFVDDIVISDSAYPGTGGLWVLPVTGNGDLQEWTASAGAQYECVNDLPGDFTNYIYASGAVAGVDSNFEFANLPLTPTAIGPVMLVAQARAAAPGSVSMRTIAYSGATVANGTTVGVDVGTVELTQIMDVDPATSAAWSESAVNALKGGVGITA